MNYQGQFIDVKANSNTQQIAVVLLPAFNAHATTGFIDPLRAANYVDARHLYRWQYYSVDGGNIPASNGMSIATEALTSLDDVPDLVLVSASWTPEQHRDKALLGALRHHAHSGSVMCGIDTGAFLLGYAGLLDKHRVTVHYEHMDAFAEVFPTVELSEDLFVLDGTILTCCGGGAATDLALEIVRSRHGIDLANAAARYIFHDRLRAAIEGQNAALHEPIGYAVDGKLREAIVLMERNLETPLSIPEVADSVNRSQRQLERLFRRYTGQSVARYYLDIRLDRARGLITQTELRVVQVAMACGFASPVHFARVYKRKFGTSPRQERITGRVPFEFRAFPMHGTKSV